MNKIVDAATRDNGMFGAILFFGALFIIITMTITYTYLYHTRVLNYQYLEQNIQMQREVNRYIELTRAQGEQW